MRQAQILVIFFAAIGIFTGCSHSNLNSAGTTGSEGHESMQIIAGGKEEVSPTIDRQHVRRAVRSKSNDIKNCYLERLKEEPDLGGRLVMRWKINSNGEAFDVEPFQEKSEIRDEVMILCVSSVLKGTPFPKAPPKTIAEVAGYPFIFSKK